MSERKSVRKDRSVPAVTSRERMLAALDFKPTDHVPCCFMGWSALQGKSTGYADYLDRQLAFGLDVVTRFIEINVRMHPDVSTREWLEPAPKGDPYPILHKEYRTPAGNLATSVNKSTEWPHGDHVPLWDDYLISHSRKALVTPADNLDALRYIFSKPTRTDLDTFRKSAADTKKLADDRNLMTTAAYIMMADMADWLMGIEPLMMASLDYPDFVHHLLDLIEDWNKPFNSLSLEAGADLIIRRGWYENADFWSPTSYREFLLPALKRQVQTVHDAGARFGYLVSCSTMPLLDLFIEAGVDVLLGIDPAQDHMMDLTALKQKTQGKMALWGGVCGYLTVECGSQEDIRREVRQALKTLAPGSGFILSPVTNIRDTSRKAWDNTLTVVETWKQIR